MPHVDLQAVVTSWVAEELEAASSRPGVSYWVALYMAGTEAAAFPRITVFMLWQGEWSSAFVPWPPDQAHVGRAVRKILGMLGLLN